MSFLPTLAKFMISLSLFEMDIYILVYILVPRRPTNLD